MALGAGVRIEGRDVEADVSRCWVLVKSLVYPEVLVFHVGTGILHHQRWRLLLVGFLRPWALSICPECSRTVGE